jgi:hypothetical protein
MFSPSSFAGRDPDYVPNRVERPWEAREMEVKSEGLSDQLFREHEMH